MRYFVAFLVTIGLIVLVLFLLFSGGGSKQSPAAIDLTKYINTGSRAQLYIEGPVVADENHQELEIDISQDQVAMTIYKGYQRTIVTTKSYANNENSYSEFLYSLERLGYTKGNSAKSVANESGYCAEGNRDVYSFNDGSKDLFRFWSTTCGPKTYGGDIASTVLLFENQVPDFNTLAQQIQFSL